MKEEEVEENSTEPKKLSDLPMEERLEELWKQYKMNLESDEEYEDVQYFRSVMEEYYPNNKEKQKDLFFAIQEAFERSKEAGTLPEIDKEIAKEVFEKHGVAEVLAKELFKLKGLPSLK